MKKLKWICCICALLCALLLTAAQAGAAANNTCGDRGNNILWTLDNDGTLTLTGEGAVRDATASPWAGCKVRRIVVNEGVTRIGRHAFSNLKDVGEVLLPESLVTIGKEAFSGCSGLREITIPSGVKEIEDYAFTDCANLFKVNTDDLAAWCAIRFRTIFANPLYEARRLYVNNEKVVSLEIPAGVTAIGDFAFSSSPELRCVKLPEGLESIGRSAFYECSGLTAVTLPDSLKRVGQNAFARCFRLDEVTVGSIIGEKTMQELSIPAGALRKVTVSRAAAVAPDAFKAYGKLETVELPASLKSVGKDAFFNCSGLKNVIISDIGAWCGIDFGNPFANPLHASPDFLIRQDDKLVCVTDAELPEGVTAVKDYVFYGCRTLKCVSLPETAVSIGAYAFQDCKSLREAVLSPDLAAVGQYAFKGCTGLCEISVGRIIAGKTLQELSVPAEAVKMVTVLDGAEAIAPNAFKNCGKLESVVLAPSVQAFGTDAFLHCAKLRNVVISDLAAWCRADFACPVSNPLIYADHFYLKEGDLLTELNVLQIPEGITEIRQYAFNGYGSLCAVKLPEGVTRIGRQAFFKCPNLQTALLPSTLTSIGQEAFRGCAKLRTLSLPSGMTDIAQNAFYDCGSLEELKIGGLIDNRTLKQLWLPTASLKKIVVTEGVTAIAAEAFRDCKKLQVIELPDSLRMIGNDAFFGCSSLRIADVAGIRQWLETDLVSPFSNPLIYAHRLFVRGREVLAVTVPEGVTEIRDYAFYGAEGIRTLRLSSDVKRIGKYAFYGCTGLSRADLPEGIKEIDDYAFRNCTGLFELVLPASLHYVGQGAFDGCCRLACVRYAGTKEQWSGIGGSGLDFTRGKPMKVHYACPAAPETVCTVACGDADGDGVVTAADARLALRVSVFLEPCAQDSERFIGCDWDCNGCVTPADARMILRCAVGLT